MRKRDKMKTMEIRREPESDIFYGVIIGSMETAVKVMQQVIENKLRNNEKLSDNDIYNIYKDSFSKVMHSMEDNMMGEED